MVDDMNDSRLKIGIMGARMGGAHAGCFKALKDLAVVTAVCEKETELHGSLDHDLEPGAVYYSDFDEFIRSGIDAVVLANYFHEHAIYAIKAFEAGVDVLSETTAAPSLAQCVELVEAAEKYGRKYMLAINCPFFPAVYNMKKMLEDGKVGKVLYGAAEYLHTDETSIDSKLEVKKITELDMDNLHWRQTMPNCYYNMHTLGTLMYITNTLPVSVYCSAIKDEEFCKQKSKATDCPGAVVITKMNDDSVFHTTGCANYGPTSKWYRLNCEKGCMETERYDYKEQRFIFAKRADFMEYSLPSGSTSGLENQEIEEIKKYADTSHHGGINFYTAYHFVKYLLGEEECVFDVYRAATLSAAGILAWYSALTGKEFRIPDFKNAEDRDKIRYDSRIPIAKSQKDITLPFRLSDKDKFDLYDSKYGFSL